MKKAEREGVECGMPLQDLMENTGRACFDKINEITGNFAGKSFIILCGKGNNGGGGVVLAHHLNRVGAQVICVFVNGLPASECAKESYRRYGNQLTSVLYNQNEDNLQKLLACCDVIVDCVFGTGFHGVLEPKPLFNFINNKAIRILIVARNLYF